MEELKKLLIDVEDSYFDFVTAMLHYAEKNSTRLEKLLNFINTNPNAKSSDIINWVSSQEDFWEDASYMKVG